MHTSHGQIIGNGGTPMLFINFLDLCDVLNRCDPKLVPSRFHSSSCLGSSHSHGHNFPCLDCSSYFGPPYTCVWRGKMSTSSLM